MSKSNNKSLSSPFNGGKGSARRRENPKKVWDNWSEIKGFKKSKFR